MACSPTHVDENLSPSNPNSLLFSVRNRLDEMKGMSKLAAEHPEPATRACIGGQAEAGESVHLYSRHGR